MQTDSTILSESTKDDKFRQELTDLINRYSIESASNTPDYILAMYLHGCLHAFNEAVQQRETWYGRDPRPSIKNV